MSWGNGQDGDSLLVVPLCASLPIMSRASTGWSLGNQMTAARRRKALCNNIFACFFCRPKLLLSASDYANAHAQVYPCFGRACAIDPPALANCTMVEHEFKWWLLGLRFPLR